MTKKERLVKHKMRLTIQNGCGQDLVLDSGQGSAPILTQEDLLACDHLRITSNTTTNGNMDFGSVIPVFIVPVDAPKDEETDEPTPTRIKLFYDGLITPYAFSDVKSLYDFFMKPDMLEIAQPPIKAEVYLRKGEVVGETE